MSVAVLVAAACVSISTAHITAGDLAKAIPSYIPLDPTVVLAWSPAPGVPRVFHASQLTQFIGPPETASAPQPDICFERPLSALTETAVNAAMRAVLGKDAQIELLEISRFQVPEGEIVFPRESLGSSPTALWRGFVRYDADKKFDIWARVKVRVVSTRVIAAEALEEGKPIQFSQLKLEMVENSINQRPVLSALDQAEGYVPRHKILANSPVWVDTIEMPKEILRGDRVIVTVHSGLAVLTLAVDATTSGRRGDIISLKNPESGRLFRARVEGPKLVSLQIEPVKP